MMEIVSPLFQSPCVGRLENDFILACVQQSGVKFKDSDHEG